jgi:outer membrane receptor protein involved in Fe transport
MFAIALILAQTAVSDAITVTATRTETRVADTPSSVVVLSKETLANSAAATTDDALRQVAGFTLFRRAGSRVANPTAQGVTLRGAGASGASRALVLDDGVPLNDPFGGWVYWARVPRAGIERIEVLRGGASDLYGSSAMGGVIQFIRKKSPGVSVDVSAGSEATASATAFFGTKNFTVSTDLFSTDGFVLVRPEERGLVDVEADSRHATLDLTARGERAFARGSYYREERNNGTPLQVNDTTTRQLAAGLDAGALMLRAYASDQDYFQTFSVVTDDRNSERLTVEQRVPSRGYGGNAQWTRLIANRHVIIAGMDLRSVRGFSDELRGTTRVIAGGRQRTAAAYIEDLISVSPALTLTAGLRGDWWSDHSQVNPRLSLLWRSFSASAYTAFRAPTLNELYRGFRVGNINTLPNANLDAENMTGFEIGKRAGNSRVTIFWTAISNTIANVTLNATTRERQNLGRTWSRGLELDGEWPIGRNARASLGYMFVDATVREGDLRGKRIPQVARNQVTAQLQWRTFGVQTRWSASQFDDDRNELPLRGYFVADAFASHPLKHGVDVTFAIENVFNEDVEVSAAPVVSLGQPRAWRVGLRYTR